MKGKQTKRIVGVLLAATLAATLAGCQDEGSKAKSTEGKEMSSSSETSSGKQVLKVAVSSTTSEDMYKQFEEENNCEVEQVVIAHDGWADYLTKLQTMMVSGNGPDVFQNPHEGGKMANSLDISLPLNDYIDEHPDEWEEYLEATVDTLEKAREVDGKIYGLPCFYQTAYVWLNLDRLEAANLDVPDVDWSWDEFEHYLDVLSQPDSDGNPQYAWAVPDYYFVYNQWLYSFGTGYLDDNYKEVTFDSDASIELMQYCADAVKKGAAPMPDKNYDYQQQLVDGHVAMANAGRWMISYCNNNDFDNVAVVRVPKKYSDRQEYAIGNFEICSSTGNYDLAAKFCFYTTGKDWQEQFANDTANIPSRKDVNLTDPLTDKGYVNQDIFDNLPDGSFPMQNPTSFPEISNIFDRAFTSIMAEEISPADGCRQAAEEMRAAVAQNPD